MRGKKGRLLGGRRQGGRERNVGSGKTLSLGFRGEEFVTQGTDPNIATIEYEDLICNATDVWNEEQTILKQMIYGRKRAWLPPMHMLYSVD